MTFEIERVKNRSVTIRDRTGGEYRGIVKEIHADAFILENGDGTTVLINRRSGNVVSIRLFP